MSLFRLGSIVKLPRNLFKSLHLAILKAESKTMKSWVATPSHISITCYRCFKSFIVKI